MAKNDVVLIDAIINDRIQAGVPSNQRDEVFEYFSFEQLLKDFDLSRDEIESGWVDGRNDGGIDGLFILINGHLLQDARAFTWPKRSAEIEVHIVTCKHHDTFQQGPLNAILASLTELLDFGTDDNYLRDRYGSDLLKARKLLLEAYKQLSSARPSLRFQFSYASRGDATNVGESVRTRAEQIVTETKSLFSQCNASFAFIGAAELISAYRRTKSFNFDLRAIEIMTTGPGNYVAIVRLEDYKKFVTDDSGNLRRYLFDSNVRDYLGENSINEDIANSLTDGNGPEFWWLNNGVTLLATGATAAGKVLSIQDTQIVNGLQTTESIFRHFQRGSGASAERGLLVKVVVSEDAVIRDQIIRATNNQSLVEAASLHATDKVQRDIEEILERSDWYYERRKNYFRNIGKPAARFVTPLYLAGGYIALVMKNPAIAARLKAKFMRTNEGYESVFSSEIPIEIWVRLVEILKRIEATLSNIRLSRPNENERFLASWRSLVALLAVSRIFGTFNFSIDALVKLDLEKLDENLITEMWFLIEKQRGNASRQKLFQNGAFVDSCCERLNQEFGITNLERVGKQRPPGSSGTRRKVVEVAEEFINKVDAELPAQPWKPGMHLEMITKLKCSKNELATAINKLIEVGRRMNQRDGIVYDASGNVVSVDTRRISSGPMGNS